MYYKLRFQEQLENILMPQTQKILNFSWRTKEGGSYIVQEAGIKIMEKKYKKANWLSEDALQIAVNKREAIAKGEKRMIYPFECRVPKNSKES